MIEPSGAAAVKFISSSRVGPRYVGLRFGLFGPAGGVHRAWTWGASVRGLASSALRAAVIALERGGLQFAVWPLRPCGPHRGVRRSGWTLLGGSPICAGAS